MNNSTPSLELIEETRRRLADAFNPEQLAVIDDSHHHEGHAGAQDGKRHLTVKIRCASLAAIGRLAAHRAVYSAVGDLMETRIHALRIIILG